MNDQTKLVELYAAFNARDIASVLASLAPTVDWPNGWEGGRLHGRAAVEAYWLRQWSEIEPTVIPTGFERLDDGRIAVRVHQIVKDRKGALLADGFVQHVYTLHDGIVTRMEIRQIVDADAPRR